MLAISSVLSVRISPGYFYQSDPLLPIYSSLLYQKRELFVPKARAIDLSM
jgi:hypothetical protein